MKRVLQKVKQAKESKFTKLIFDHPIIKFISLIFIQIIIFNLETKFPKNVPVRWVITIISILIAVYFIIVIIKVITRSLDHLMNPRNILSLMGAYILLIIAFLVVFATMYNFAELSHLGYIKYGQCTDQFNSDFAISDPDISREFLYFTAITFFTVGYGDICPMGFAKIISMLVAFTGHIVSVIVVALIIQNYFRKQKQN